MKKYIFYLTPLIFLCCQTKIDKPKKSDFKQLAIRANNFLQEKNYIQAKLAYDTLISIDSSKPQFYYGRAYSKSILDDDRGAINDFFKALHYNYRKKESIYLHLGVIYVTNDMPDSALYYYDKCLAIDPTNEGALKEKEIVLQLYR